MDRKGKQKLKRYFIVYVIFAVFFTVGMYLITKYEENAKATQIALLLAEHPELEIEVVPGITAACSGAAVLGAPLISDFCLISLSDLLTPWEKIEKRLDCASQADFCICLYNPSSFKRHDYLQKACDIMLKNQRADVPAGIVRNIGREGENYEITTLRELRDKEVDMFSTVIIGNSQTEVINGKLVTPRGYKL